MAKPRKSSIRNDKDVNEKWTDEELHLLGKKLIEYVSAPKVYHISGFSHQYGFGNSWLNKLISRHPIMKNYHEQAMEILGLRVLDIGMEANHQWLVKTFVPKYLTDVQEYLDDERDKENLSKAKAAKAVNAEASENVEYLINLMNQFVTAKSNE